VQTPVSYFVSVSVLIGGDSPGYRDNIRGSSMGESLGNTRMWCNDRRLLIL
jgi:hypothetical protein